MHGVAWSISGNVLARAIGLVTTVTVVRILGKEAYGHVAIVQTTVDMFLTAGGLGLSFTATKHVAEYCRSNPAKAGRIIAMTSVVSWLSGGVFALLLILFAPWLAMHTLHAPGVTPLLQLGACLVLFATVNASQTGTLTGFEAFRRRAKVNSFASLVGLPLAVGGAFWGGATGTVCALIVGAAILTSLNSWSVKQVSRTAGVSIDWNQWYREAPLVVRFGIPTMAASLIVAPVSWFCSTLLVRAEGKFSELAVYNAANQWFGAIMFLPSALSVVSIPILAGLVRDNQWTTLRRLTWKSVKLHGLILIPAVALAVGSPWIMRMYGAGFAVGAPVMVIHLATAVVVAMHSPVWPLLLAAGKVRAVLLMNVGWAAVFIALSWIGVPWGAIGLSSARLCAYVAYTLSMFGMTYTLLRRNPDAPAT